MSTNAVVIIGHGIDKKNRYVGLALAVTSTLAIGENRSIYEPEQGLMLLVTGTSFVITKKVGLQLEEAILTTPWTGHSDPIVAFMGFLD